MKKVIVFLIFLTVALVTFGQDQEPATTLAGWWERYMWVILLGVALAVDMLLDKTKLKEKLGSSAIGNIILKGFAMLLAFLGRKSVQAYKAVRGSKKTTLILVLACFMGASHAQVSMFKPVPKDLLNMKSTVPGEKAVKTWLPRWATGVEAWQVWYDKQEKTWKQEPFARAGVGISAAHYGEYNGELVNDFSVTGFVFLPTREPFQSITLAGVVSALKWAGISPGIGAGYDFGIKAPVGLINAVVTF